MKVKAEIKKIYQISENVVARDLQGEFVIIPITSGVGDMEDEIFSLNGTGRSLWDQLDGKKSLRKIIEDLSEKFEGDLLEIEKDCLGFTTELLKRKMLVEVRK